ncbi:MAG: hypothetical protein ACW9XH_06875 [Candidatus Nitrosopumilus sp. bin_32a]
MNEGHKKARLVKIKKIMADPNWETSYEKQAKQRKEDCTDSRNRI